MKQYTEAFVVSQSQVEDNIFDLRLLCPEIASIASPGQFVCVYMKSDATLLPRPISICYADADTVRLVYRVVGRGTAEMAGYRPGDSVRLLGPLGNGYPMVDGRKLLVGGGLGIPPLIFLADSLPRESFRTVLGYRDSRTFLASEFSEPIIATDDGSVGTRGTVVDAIETLDAGVDVIYACGPMPMLRGIKEYAALHGIIAYISLEEHMACGVGACLGCTVATTGIDAHSHVHNARICTEGPVFDSREVQI